MFARKLEFDLVVNKKQELLSKIREDVLPTLKNQPGFIDLIGLTHEIKVEKALVISLWRTREDALRYDNEVFPTISRMMKPYLMTGCTVTPCIVETTMSDHFLTAVAWDYVPPDDFKKSLLSAGVPESSADALLDLQRLYREGTASLVDLTVEQLTGRKAISFDEFVRDYNLAFQQEAKAAS